MNQFVYHEKKNKKQIMNYIKKLTAPDDFFPHKKKFKKKAIEKTTPGNKSPV